MARVRADDQHDAAPPDHPAALAHRLYGRSNLHRPFAGSYPITFRRRPTGPMKRARGHEQTAPRPTEDGSRALPAAVLGLADQDADRSHDHAPIVTSIKLPPGPSDRSARLGAQRAHRWSNCDAICIATRPATSDTRHGMQARVAPVLPYSSCPGVSRPGPHHLVCRRCGAVEDLEVGVSMDSARSDRQARLRARRRQGVVHGLFASCPPRVSCY
jgi:hypothetical protein